ncbi:hypothetical protein LX97_02233 [Nonlabens dokdonensis]|jgi:hypothetical protein|uniref:Lipoprotein n=2 Tax=Nonlabens dokdonensis TaxID=328515 RepID=L7WBT5_NONDD|nr:hypothetical protein [Nonlabens dokdonensis]AGC77574.1 hypothetical protein DDD_2447 [Nonlabens dokdonensis DSW-6]PZX39875.1 hypothetical protein LX97_02233 [Nonlabens dokdonensis]
MRFIVFLIVSILLLISCEQNDSYDYLPKDLRAFAKDAKLVESWDLTENLDRVITINLYKNDNYELKKYVVDYDIDNNYKFNNQLIVKGDSVYFYRSSGYSKLHEKSPREKKSYILLEINKDFTNTTNLGVWEKETYFGGLEKLISAKVSLDSSSFEKRGISKNDYLLAKSELEFINSSILK